MRRQEEFGQIQKKFRVKEQTNKETKNIALPTHKRNLFEYFLGNPQLYTVLTILTANASSFCLVCKFSGIRTLPGVCLC